MCYIVIANFKPTQSTAMCSMILKEVISFLPNFVRSLIVDCLLHIAPVFTARSCGTWIVSKVAVVWLGGNRHAPGVGFTC